MSTMVATNGVEEVAGSAPSRRKHERQHRADGHAPQHHCDQRDADGQTDRSPSARQNLVAKVSHRSKMRAKPIEAGEDSAERQAEGDLAAHHRPPVGDVTSSRAIARTTSVAAWEPLLPPLEMISGTKNSVSDQHLRSSLVRVQTDTGR